MMPDSQKTQKYRIGGEGLLKLPQLWKKAKRCAAFSHNCLDRRAKDVLGDPQFQQALQRVTNKFTKGRQKEKLTLKHASV